MPRKPNVEEIRALIDRHYQNHGIDPNEFWASIPGETLEATFRPPDILEPAFFRQRVEEANPNTTFLNLDLATPLLASGNITGTSKMLVVRSLHLLDSGADDPDTIELQYVSPGNGDIIVRIDNPLVGGGSNFGGDNIASQVLAAQLPILVFPGDRLKINEVISPSGGLNMAVTIVGEEWDFPLRYPV